jgi:hypothetical protein
MAFKINLKNEKLPTYNRLSKLIIFIFVVFFCYLAVFSELKHIRIKSIGTIVLLFICFGLQFYFKKSKYSLGNRPFFIVILLGWITLENYWMAGITLLFDLFSMITTRSLDVYFTRSHIQYPSIPAKQIQWDELNQVILKDGLLTIDFKSNKLIQQMTDAIKTTVDEKEFNDFCRQQLNK